MTPRALRPLDVPLAGVTLVEASAGTGKTFTLTTLYLRLLLERSLPPEEILVVTYTNAATAELHTRVRGRLLNAIDTLEGGPPADDELAAWLRGRTATAAADRRRLRAALFSFDDAAIFTIHGFCQRVLQDHAFESGVAFEAELVTDQRALVRAIVRDFWARELQDAPEEFARALAGRKGDPIEELVSLALVAVAQPDMPVLPPIAARTARPTDATPDLEGTVRGVGRAATVADSPWLDLQVALVGHVRAEIGRRKDELNVRYFDDLLIRLRDALAGPGGAALAAQIRRRYRAALIDEFQDTDPLQYEIFDRLYAAGSGASLVLIGDPKQAIYSFRGADVFTYVGAKRGAESAHTLGVNRRSDGGLVGAVNELFGAARRPFLLDDIDFAPAQALAERETGLGGSWAERAPFEIHYVRNGGKPTLKPVATRRIAAATAADVARFLAAAPTIAGEPARPDHIAVLCRTNAQAHLVQAELRKLDVPSVLQTDTSVLDTAEAAEMERVVRAMAEPGDSRAIVAALATPLLGLSAAELRAMRDGAAAWDEWIERFHRLHDLWLGAGFTPALSGLLAEARIAERALAATGGERRMTNVFHLAEILQNAAGPSRRGPQALAEWFVEVRRSRDARQEEIAGEEAQIRLESDDRALRLVTIHRAKGLEYPVVYCPFLWEGSEPRGNERSWPRFHDPSNGMALTLDVGSEALETSKTLARRESLAENLRLVYVALTRARHRCVVVWGVFNKCASSALGYLLHQPSDAGAGAADLAAAASKRVGSLADEEMIADLERLAERAGGAIEVRELDESPAPRYRRPDEPAAELRCPALARVLRPTWRTSSFSALVSGADRLSGEAEEGLDRDEADEGAPAAPPAPAQPIALADFPSGTRAGQLVHSVFENLDFRATPMEVRALVGERLEAFGFDAAWCDPLARAVGDVLDTPLAGGDGAPFRLATVPPEARLNELEFLFPVLDDGADGFRSDQLAAVFERHAGAVPGAAYVERLRHLGFAPLAGFLRGFVDLVFEHRGRWYIVDWKSNHLGPRADHYGPAALAGAMAEHHYHLQYHLYAVALHRHLAQRLDGYRYQRHFGGVFYLFVRGMAPSHPAGTGVFFDRPPPALVDGLAAALAG